MAKFLFYVRGDRMGDALLKWPTLKALRQALPEDELIWVAGKRKSIFKGALKYLGNDLFDELHDECNIGERWSELVTPPPFRGHHYRIVVASEHKLRSALIIRRISHTFFISPALGFRLSDLKPDPKTSYPKTVHEQFLLLANLVVGRQLEPVLDIPLPASVQYLAKQLLPTGSTYVGFSPGASSPRKRWPLERFIAVAQHQVHSDRKPVFFLGPDEVEYYAPLKAQVPQALFPEFQSNGEPLNDTLLTMALARQLQVSLANDAGGGHLLATGRRPIVSLFGHTDEKKFAPPYCFRHAIRARDYGGVEMQRIPVCDVIDAIDAALDLR